MCTMLALGGQFKQMPHITREMVLTIFMCDAELTSRDVADKLGAHEYAVRAAISWLIIGKHLMSASIVARKTKNGDSYTACAYRWTGRHGPIHRVCQDPSERDMDGVITDAIEQAMSRWKR